MYKNIRQTINYLTALQKLTADIERWKVELFVIPSYTSLSAAVEIIDPNFIKLGAQNMCWEDSGQFTGEISPLMLKELRLDIIEIGHSERRHKFGENDIVVNKKVLAALQHKFTALVCVGETLKDKEYGVANERLREQVKIALHGVSKEEICKVWVAYEPVWAIGIEGIPADPEYANEKQAILKETLNELFPDQSKKIPVLYGGSVNRNNASSFVKQPSIDGLFVGRAAWEANHFNELIRQVLMVWEDKRKRG